MFSFDNTFRFPQPRSMALAPEAMVATSHPLAAEAGITMLRSGGNAIDAAVSAAAVLTVVEPMSTGLGGDAFALIYSAADRSVHALNGSGRSPALLSLDYFRSLGLQAIPELSGLSMMTPGVVEAWAQCHQRFGKLDWKQVLSPAIHYAEKGFLVTPIAAATWKHQIPKLSRNIETARIFLPGGKAPLVGSRFCNPDLSRTLRLTAEKGVDEFYRGTLAEKIVEAVRAENGVLSLEDLDAHRSDWVSPIASEYRGYTVLQLPPNSQGLVVALALKIMQTQDLSRHRHNSAPYLHFLIETLKIALAEAAENVADPAVSDVVPLLLDRHIDSLSAQINHSRARLHSRHSLGESDTVYISVVDGQGNAVSFINSLYRHFGSGITVPGTGIMLQNRAIGFAYDSSHPNCIGPRKRCYHTLIPAMVLKDGELWGVLGVVGGYMQPQAQVQLIANMIDFHMNPQSALDAPRFRFVKGMEVSLEQGIGDQVREELALLGHQLQPGGFGDGYGGGQVIVADEDGLCGGSDFRKDGCALGY